MYIYKFVPMHFESLHEINYSSTVTKYKKRNKSKYGWYRLYVISNLKIIHFTFSLVKISIRVFLPVDRTIIVRMCLNTNIIYIYIYSFSIAIDRFFGWLFFFLCCFFDINFLERTTCAKTIVNIWKKKIKRKTYKFLDDKKCYKISLFSRKLLLWHNIVRGAKSHKVIRRSWPLSADNVLGRIRIRNALEKKKKKKTDPFTMSFDESRPFNRRETFGDATLVPVVCITFGFGRKVTRVARSIFIRLLSRHRVFFVRRDDHRRRRWWRWWWSHVTLQLSGETGGILYRGSNAYT